MSTVSDFVNGTAVTSPAPRPALSERWQAHISRFGGFLDIVGLGWIVPLMRMATGEPVKPQLAELWRSFGIPLVAIVLFLAAWGFLAPKVKTSLGVLPGPVQVWQQAENLWGDHLAERDKKQAFYTRQEKRNAELLAGDPKVDTKIRPYTGAPTYLDQILTSLETVFTGFIFATLIAVPLGVLCGLSQNVNTAINPLVQIFKPVSPLAWLPLVTMVVSAIYVSNDPLFPKSFLVSAITVTLCSLWPTLVNTAVGVASIDKDLINVARVLRLPWYTKVWKIVLPSSLPLIFTGLRLSLGVGWMVLIAAEMLAQNPGLGKFVWDEFQNGSSVSLSKIMVAVFTIGIIGFLLDRVMLAFQTAFTHSPTR
jgi:nitrate/nitrite transport system permease protein